MDANVSRGQLKNLVTDRPSPITVKLAQKSDKDNVFKLMDANVSRGQLKNLVTDRPSPITVKLAQKSDKDNVFKLMDANVTRGQMKNLVTDRPSPITVKLAQKQGVPVHVNPVLMRPTGAESEQLGLKLRIGPDDVEVEKRKAQATATQQLSQNSNATFAQKNGVPVLVDPVLMKPTGAENASLGLNIAVDGAFDIKLKKNSTLSQKNGVPVLVDPVLMPNEMSNATLGLNMKIGPDSVSVMKRPANATLLGLAARNPVENPPFNNWSVNQPAVPHDQGWKAGADWGQDIIVDGHHVHY